MAITNPTKLSDFSGFLNRRQSQPIFEAVARRSVVQSLAREIPLGASGEAIPVTTGALVAGWVSEGAAKPASSGSMTLKNMDPQKLAVIAVVSSEVLRANPGNYMNVIRNQIADAFAIAFDKAALYDQGPAALGSEGAAGGGPFSTYVAQTTNSVEIGTAAAAAGGIHGDFVAALSALVADGSRLTGWALDDRLEPLLLAATDTTGRPLYVDLSTGQTELPTNGEVRRGSVLGRPAYMSSGVYSGTTADIEGFGGDWNQAAWGVVGGINYSVSTEATVTIGGTLTSLWENNLVAIRAEAEYGFVMNDADSFVKLLNAA